jgi:hypothetical protein
VTGPRIDLPRDRPLSFEEFAARQSAPLSALRADDPSKETTTALGRPLTFAEFQQVQGLSGQQAKSWKIPALPLPTIARDVTKTPNDERTKGKPIENGIAGPIMRQLVDPVLEHPLASAPFLALTVPGVAAAAPLAAAAGAVVAGAGAVSNIARYGWTKAHELQMTPEERTKSEADPNRVSGEAAAMQAIALGLAPLVHVGVGRARAAVNAATDFSGGVLEAGARGAAEQIDATAPRANPQLIEGMQRSDFAAQLARGAQTATPEGLTVPKGLQTTPEPLRAGRVKPVEGLQVPETVTPGRVKPIETQPANAPLEERASIDEARRAYEAQRLAEDQADLAAQRTADAEKLLGLSGPEQPDLTPKRRPGGVKREPAPFFESPQGAEVLGAMAARHGLPEEANPYHPGSELAPEWTAGHQNATESYPLYPDGFTMGGAESRIPEGFTAPHPQGFEPTSAVPEGATPETAQLAAALKPSRFRGHSTDELVRIAQSARETIDRAQREIDNAAQDAAPIAAERAVTRANSTLAQTEREFALRGITGDKLAQLINPERSTEPGGGLTPIEGTGETRTRGLAAGIEEKAIANKIDVAFGDLPQYRVMSIADQAHRAAQLLVDDPAHALEIAKGNAQPPSGLHPESVLVAVENRAIADGDVATLRELATGKLTAEGTTMGQRIRLLGERDADSPVAAMQDVINKRSGGAANAVKAQRATDVEVGRIHDHIAATPIDKGVLVDFVNSLKC